MNQTIIRILTILALCFMTVVTAKNLVLKPNLALSNSDFAAFYCGSVVASHHQDPYASTALRECQIQQIAIPYAASPKDYGITPDPIPGYDIGFFKLLTFLSYAQATIIWTVILLAAVIGTAVLMTRLTRLPLLLTLVIFSYIDMAVSIPLCQLPPVLIFGLTLAAYGLVNKRNLLTYLGVMFMMIEPHVGLPVFCALFIWQAQLRLGLLGIAIGFVAFSIVTLGVPLNIEYFKIVLPAQAQAEAVTNIQYSLAWLLHYIGIKDDVRTLRIASDQYIIFVFIAIGMASWVAKRLNSSAALVFFPAALIVIGGPYIHIQQIAAALPFALLLATKVQGRAATMVWIAIGLLAIPWAVDWRTLFIGGVLILLSIACYVLRKKSKLPALYIALSITLLYVVLIDPVFKHIVPAGPSKDIDQVMYMPYAFNGDRLASWQDAQQVRGPNSDLNMSISTPRTLATKIPTWLALFIIIGVGISRVASSAS